MTQKYWFRAGHLITFPLFGLAFLALRMVAYGVWFQAEFPVTAFTFLGAMGFIWLMLGFRFMPKLIQSTLKHPLVWVSMLIALASILFAPFQPVPLVTLWGAPQMGEGVLSYMATSSLAAVFMIQLRFPTVRKALIYWAFFVGTIISVLTILGSIETPFKSFKGWPWSPYYFPDYLGFIVLAFGVYLYHLWKQDREKVLSLILPGIAFPVLFYFTYNKSMWYGCALALIGIVGLRFISKCSSFQYRKLFPYFALLALYGFILTLAIASAYGWPIPGTLITRGYFILYTFYNFLFDATPQDILTLFIGRGWGEYQEFIAPNIFEVNSAKIYAGAAKALTANEETIERDFFHSHNMIIETFSALGIFGIALITTKIYYLSKALKRHCTFFGALYLLSLWLLSSFWFEMTATVPFTIMATLLVTGRMAPKRFPQLSLKLLKPAFVSLAILLMVPLGPIGISSEKIVNVGKIRMSESYLGRIEEIKKDKWVNMDSYFGFKRVSPVLQQLTYLAFTTKDEKKLSLNDKYEGNMRIADYMFSKRLKCGNLYAMMVPINIYGELASHEKLKDRFYKDKKAFDRWEDIVTTFHKCVPKRTDMFIPLLNHLTLSHRTGRVRRLTRLILSHNPKDPVGLWFSGSQKMEADATLHEGLQEIRLAYKLGINRYIPIPERLLSILKMEA